MNTGSYIANDIQKHWKAQAGELLQLKQSHAGSTKQVRAVADGLEADVITMNQATDVEFLAQQGLVAKDSVAFVRPHDIDLGREPAQGAISALVRHVHPIGPIVRVELEHEGDTIEVELTRERHQALGLAAGQTAWLKPRQVKIFAANEPRHEAAPMRQALTL